MTKDEFTRKLAKLNQIMNELIYALMQTGMTYRQAEEEERATSGLWLASKRAPGL